MVIKYRHLGILLSLLFYGAIVLGGQSAFSDTADLDSQLIERLAQDGETGGGSYGAMAALYLLIPGGLHQIITLLIGSAFILTCFRGATRREAAMIIGFLTLAPSILTIANFQKDTVLVVFVLAVWGVLQSRWKPLWKTAAVLAIYLAYASLFRQYYYLIAVFFAAFLILRRGGALAVFYVVVLVGFSLIFVPPEIYETLQGSRDTINTFRLNRPAWERPRTAFLNPVPPDGLWNFLVNYAHALFRLNLFVLISPGPKELFLLLNAACYIGFFAWGYRQEEAATGMAAALGLAHLTVLHLFEPDNGSYVRHLGSTLPYLAICLNAFFATRRIRLTRSEEAPPVPPGPGLHGVRRG